MAGLVTIGITISRAEALVVASMLRGYGIHVEIPGEAHATVEYISHTLGGYRLMVIEDDASSAREILRQSGVCDPDQAPNGTRRALLRFMAVYLGLKAGFLAFASLFGAVPMGVWVLIPVEAISIPVNPQGRGDYFLGDPEV